MALALALAAGLLSPSSAHAVTKPKLPDTGRVTFGLQPVTGEKLDVRPNYRYSVTPGGRLMDHVAIRNLSDVPATFSVYATDALNVDNGNFGLLSKAQRPVDVGRWLSVGDSGFTGSVTVQSRSNVILPLRLTVPAQAQSGDHTGGIVVSLATRSRRGATAVVLDQRVGVRVFVRVSGPQRPALTIRPVKASYLGTWNPFGRGHSTVTYTVTNTGNVNLAARQRVVVRGPFGPSQKSNTIVDLGLLLPGGSAQFTTTVPKTLPVIRERAQVSLTPLVQVGDQVPSLGAFTGHATFWAVPWTLIVFLVIVGLFGCLAHRRRHRSHPPVPGLVGAGRSGERRAAKLAASTTLAVAATIAFPAGAHASGVPWTDPAATGGISLCSARGVPVTSGSIDLPIAATAVGASHAPAPYDGPSRSASLVASQPRQGIAPGEWSGMGMTALSRYSNPAHPTVEILPADYTLRGVTQAYPPAWDGILQLRIYLRAVNTPTFVTSYSATAVRIRGDSWQQVGEAAGDVCRAGRATSVVKLLGLPVTKVTQSSATESASPSLSDGAPLPSSTPSLRSVTKSTDASHSPPTTRAGVVKPAATQQVRASDTRSVSSSGRQWPWLLGLVLAAAALAFALLRRRAPETRPRR